MNERSDARAGPPAPRRPQLDNWIRLLRQHIAHLPGSRAQLVHGQATYFVDGRPFARIELLQDRLAVGLWLPPATAGQLLAAGQATGYPFDPSAVTVEVQRERELPQALQWIDMAYRHARVK